MKFNLIINATKPWNEGAEHARSLAASMIRQGHEIDTIFFNGDAVRALHDPKQQNSWQELLNTQTFQILFCSTWLDALCIESGQVSEHSPFQVSGLAAWIAATERADKTVEVC